MGRLCEICSRPDRLEIDRAILNGSSKAGIARSHGVSHDAVLRHATNHLSRQLLKSHEMRTALETQSLVDEVDSLVARTKRILDQAEADGLHLVSLKAIAELRQTFAFMVTTSFMLRQDQREQAHSDERLEIESLKRIYTRAELEELQRLLAKRTGPTLAPVPVDEHHWDDWDDDPAPPRPPAPPRKQRPPIRPV